MKSNRLLFLILLLGGLSAQADSSDLIHYSEYIYRAGHIESADQCPAPESQTRKPRFKPLSDQIDLLRDLNHSVIQISPNGPPEIASTYFQLDFDRMPEVNNRNVYVYYNCDGEKYFSFKVFRVGSLVPIMLIGVSERDTSIFANARKLNNALALAEIDPDHFSAPTSNLLQNRLDPAHHTVSPITAQTQASLGRVVPLEISKADVKAANEAVKLQPSDETLTFKPVERTVPRSSQIRKSAVRIATRSSPAPILGNIEAYHRIAPWSKVRGSMLWTRQAVESIQSHMTALNRARDINEFCPGYTRSMTTESQHIACWIRIVGGIMEKESGFRTRDSLIENSGEASVGLMAMSAGQCPNAPSSRALMNPIKNIECAIDVMASLVQRDGYLSGPRRQGAARNWSCLQTSHRVYVRSLRKNIRVGFKQDIIRVAWNYDRMI